MFWLGLCFLRRGRGVAFCCLSFFQGMCILGRNGVDFCLVVLIQRVPTALGFSSRIFFISPHLF